MFPNIMDAALFEGGKGKDRVMLIKIFNKPKIEEALEGQALLKIGPSDQKSAYCWR
jgi:hypothetical protein